MADAVAPPDASSSAEPARLGSWSGQGVSIGDVNDALMALRGGEERAATRISTINLVVVATDDAGADRAARAMRRLGRQNPGRTVIVVPRPGTDLSIDADIHLHTATVDSRAVWWEEVRIVVGGPVCGHLDSLVEPLTLGEMPVTLWYVSSIPDPAEPLVGTAGTVVVESPGGQVGEGTSQASSGVEGNHGVLASLVDLAQRRPVVDLTWLRLNPWRQMLAHLFDVRAYRPFVHAVQSAEVAGPAGSALLLAGWLADRLGLDASSVVRRSAADSAALVTALHEGSTGRFRVEGEGGGRRVRARAEVDRGRGRESTVAIEGDPTVAALGEALTRHSHDRIYESAIEAALDVH
ncbi:MAG TPA: glucose-6-phosphate dehydrogenase assembly protein OpcA [Acidimicrobiales bacterium]